MRKKKGFTLLELIVSMAILSMVLVVFTSLLGIGGKLGQETLWQTKASMSVAKSLEQGTDVKSTPHSLSLSFEDGNKEITVEGNMIERQEGEVTYVKFQPNQTP